MKVCITNFQKQVFKGKLLGGKGGKLFSISSKEAENFHFLLRHFQKCLTPEIVVKPMPFVCLSARFGTIGMNEVIHYFLYNCSNRPNRFRNFRPRRLYGNQALEQAVISHSSSQTVNK